MKSIGKTLKRIVEALGRPPAKPVPVAVPPEEIEQGPITRRDKRMIMKHIDELFATGAEGGVQGPAPQADAGPITKEDQALIVKHIDELFAKSSDVVQTPALEAEPGPITEQDQALIMEHVHELFYRSDEGRGGRHGETETSA